MKIETITDKDIIDSARNQLHIEDDNITVEVYTYDNGNQYLVIKREDGSGFVLQSSNNIHEYPHIELKKDSKGPCWILSHKRCGITETVFLTVEELVELKNLLYDNIP